MIGLLIGFFVFCLLAYAGIAFFFPEWVGIQGSTAKKIEASHQSTTTTTTTSVDENDGSNSKH